MPLTTVEISRANLRYNLNQFRAILPAHFKIMGVIKSNAYGHGMVAVARVIENLVDSLVVANLEEAEELRSVRIKKPILVLGNFDVADQKLIIQAAGKNISFGVGSLNLLRSLNRIGARGPGLIKVHLKIDTGMTRLGINVNQAKEFIKTALKLKFIDTQGIYSHFSVADEELAFTRAQREHFRKILNFSKEQNVRIPYQHIANSAGSLLDNLLGNAARIGVSLYGLYPSPWSRDFIGQKKSSFTLRPVLTWQTKIVQVKEVPKGSSVSYGRTFITRRRSRLAVVPVGYWDGMDRGLSNQGEVLIRGQRCPIRGRVCMNQTVVDVCALPKVRIGDQVILLGKSGREEMSAEEIASKIGTINYEVVTRINPLLLRVLV